jgi:hypothetical protein
MKKFLIFLFAFYPFICNSQVEKISFVITDGIQKASLKQTIEANTVKLLLTINKAFKERADSIKFDPKIISPEGMKSINGLWSDEHFFCYTGKIAENILMYDDYYQVRNIPIIFGKSDTLDVVLNYLPANGKINDLYIGLSAHQYKRVMEDSVTDQTRRQIILNFIENLRNYYIKKDTVNIRKLYSDKALIIIGKVLEPVNTPLDQVQNNFTKSQAKYIVLTKEEYMKRLRQVFSSTKYLLLGFDNIDVIKHRKYPNFYGVLLQQTWKSSTYSDKGWLFLLVQFKETEEPLIWVRTWQDVKDTPPDSVFGLHNFVIRQEGKVSN